MRVEHRDPSALPSAGRPTRWSPSSCSSRRARARGCRAIAALERLQANHPSRIRLVYRIVKSGGRRARAYAALDAHAEGKFFEFMDALNAARDTRLADKAARSSSRRRSASIPTGSRSP